MEHTGRSTDYSTVGFCGGKAFVAVVCALALTAVAAPAALSSSSARHVASAQHSATAALESGVLRELNEIRLQHGLVPLRSNGRLAAAAEQHSQEMASAGYFDHSSKDGTSFWQRIKQWYPRGGGSGWSVGENLLWASPGVDPARALDLWMHSPEHKANILAPRWREIGISAVHVSSAPGTYRGLPVTIITTDFGARR